MNIEHVSGEEKGKVETICWMDLLDLLDTDTLSILKVALETMVDLETENSLSVLWTSFDEDTLTEEEARIRKFLAKQIRDDIQTVLEGRRQKAGGDEAMV